MIKNPKAAAFQIVMELTVDRASSPQLAFYVGNTAIAIPSAIFDQDFFF